MRRRFLLVACFGFLNACGVQPEHVTITGRVLGHVGRPMPGAFALFHGMGVRERVVVGRDGTFSLTLDKPGAYYVWLAGVHHKSLLRPLFLDVPGHVEFDSRLSSADYVDHIDSVLVIGAFNDFSTAGGGRPLVRQPDGTFAATLEASADTFAYQLTGVQVDGDRLAGTTADDYVYDPEHFIFAGKAGKFISVMRASADSVSITFDLRDLPRSESAEVFLFTDRESRTARLSALYEDLERRSSRFSDSVLAYREAGKDMREFTYDWSEDLAAVQDMIENEADPVLQQYLLLNVFSRLGPAEEDSLLARRVFAQVPQTSLLWSLEWGGPTNTFFKICRIAKRPEAAAAYSRRVIEEHPDSTVQAAFLYHEVTRAFGVMETGRQAQSTREVPSATAAEKTFSILYDRLMTDFGDSHYAQRAKAQFAPDRNVQTGHRIPDFSVVALEDSTVTLTLQMFEGRVYLLDFWAVWCGPCVAEMEYLHAAYDKYKDRGFTIVSLSFDERPEDVAEFRRSKWEMPWLHGFVKYGFRSKLARRFEVVAIPKAILIDETATILATQGLRRESLAETLARVFGDEE